MKAHDVKDTMHAIWEPGLPRYTFLAAMILWGLTAIALIFVDPILLAGLGLATVVGALFVYRPMIPMYLIAATYPFIAWEITSGGFNAPVVDVIATAAIGAWAVRVLWQWIVYKKKPSHLALWGWPVFFIWLGVVATSAVLSYDTLMSAKYVLRVLVFFYVAFVWLPLNDIRKPRHLSRVLMIMYVVGILIALYGLYGFFAADAASFFQRRVVPVGLFGLYPLGTNHNLIADVMVTTIPIGFFLMQYEELPQRQKILFLGMLVMILATALTFSRSGWLALGLELVVLVGLLYRHHFRKLMNYGVIAGVIASPIIAYMLFFSGQSAVESSNYNRTLLNEIALEMFSDQPLWGQGPGTFLQTVGHNYVYIQEFGAPLDAHGFIQKVGAEMGAIGLLAYVGLLIYALTKIFRAYQRFIFNDVSAYLLGSLFIMVVGGIFFQLFQTSYFVGKLWFPIGVALASVAITQRELGSIAHPKK